MCTWMDFFWLSSKLVKYWIMFLTAGMKPNIRDSNTYRPGCVGITENAERLAVQVIRGLRPQHLPLICPALDCWTWLLPLTVPAPAHV